jgi:hypothetical protein
MKRLYKPVVLLLFLMTCVSVCFSQDFFKDYEKFLLSGHMVKSKGTKNHKSTTVQRLQTTLDEFEREQGHTFFNGDSIFLIAFYNAETGSTSEIIWNGEESCQYNYNYSIVRGKVGHRKLTIETDASKAVNGFMPMFKQWVLNGDTASFTNYSNAHIWFDGYSVSFTKAFKTGFQWKFIRSNAYNTEIFRDLTTY